MYDFEVIKKVLPHRYPFLLVDRVVSVDENSIVALKNVSGNEPFFSGHFPALAVMPGVLQIEAMAQAAGLILALNGGFDVNHELAFLAGVDEVKFKKPVVPGDQLKICAKIIARKTSLLKIYAESLVDESIVSMASITMVIKKIVNGV